MASENTAGPPRNLLSFGHSMVTLKVADLTFTVHKDLLVHHAEYFRGAFAHDFKEGQQQAVTLEDVTSETLTDFLTWIYFNCLPVPQLNQALQENTLPGDSSARWLLNGPWATRLISLYAFADRVLAQDFTRDIFARLYADVANHPRCCQIGPGIVCHAFEKLPESSPICRLIVDICAARPSHEIWTLTTAAETLPVEFYRAVFLKLMKEGERRNAHVKIPTLESYYRKAGEGKEEEKEEVPNPKKKRCFGDWRSQA